MNTENPDHPPPLDAPALHRPKRKYVRKARVPLYPPEVRQAMKPSTTRADAQAYRAAVEGSAEEFAGLTGGPNGACCDRCFAARCVITGMPYCGHPAKGGLHAISMQNSTVVGRYARAREYLRTGR